MSVEFHPEGPPPKKQGRTSDIREQVAELKKRPGVWAIVRKDFARGGAVTTYKAHGCEVTVRKQPDGKYTLWARWPA